MYRFGISNRSYCSGKWGDLDEEAWLNSSKFSPGMLDDSPQLSSVDSQSSGICTPECSPRETKGTLDIQELQSSYAALKEKNDMLTAELNRTKAITQTLKYVVATKDEEIKKMLLPKFTPSSNFPLPIRRKSSPVTKHP